MNRLAPTLAFIVALLSPCAEARAERLVLASASYGKNIVAICDAEGKVLWSHATAGPKSGHAGHHDIQLLDNGNLLFHENWTTLTEMTLDKKVVWSYDAGTMNGNQGKRVEVHAFQRLPSGLTMIAESGVGRIIEVDKEGRIHAEVKLQGGGRQHTRLARKLPNGNYLVCAENPGVVTEYSPQGEVIWEHPIKTRVYGAIRLRNGNTLIASGGGSSVVEVTPAGKTVWEIKDAVPETKIALKWTTFLTELDSGNFIVGNCHAGPANPQLFEIARDKKVVWQFNQFATFGDGLACSQVLGDEQAKLVRRLLAAPAAGTPTRSETIAPIRNETFDKKGKARQRKQGGNPRTANGIFVFDGSMDGDRQVDPQIAVGNGFVFHATNSGLIIYDKHGKFIQGVPQSEFNNGIDPKLFFDLHNRVFCFDLWNPWDKEKKKPVNISVSETADPTGAWNTYPVPAPAGVDGGGIGHSRKWIGYSFPGGPERTFVLKMAEAKAGKPATVYHFAGSLGHPVNTQDPLDDLYFVALTATDLVLTRVTDSGDGSPKVAEVVRKAHGFQRFGPPPQSPQKGTQQKTASGDRNPKNLVLQNGCIWFSHAVNVDGRSAVQWHQVKLDGAVAQSGRIAHPTNSYIQTTLAVNKHDDVLVGFQETGPDLFISPRCAFRRAGDPPGTTRAIIHLGEGQGATSGVAWGDYSGTVIDGDNLTDLWTIQSVANAKGRGETIIAKVPFPPVK